MQTVKRKFLRVLVDAPLAKKIAARLDREGTTGYTVIPAIGGRGRSGPWWEDQVSGVNMVMFIIVAKPEVADKVLQALAPLLDDYGLVVTMHDVDVVRPERY